MKTVGGFLDPDRVARRDHARVLIRRAAGEHVDVSTLGRRIGYTDSRWKLMMSNGELAGPALADTAVLCDVLGNNVVLEGLAGARGMRLVREPSMLTTPGEILAGAAGTMESVAQLIGAVTAALPDGIDPMEARSIQHKIEAARRSIAELEGRVAAAVVDPMPRRSSR